MFRKLPDGREIYYTWPRGTARVVRNQSVKAQIRYRDNLGMAYTGVMGVMTALHVRSIPVVLTILITVFAWAVERRKYLSKLPKVSLVEVTSTCSEERRAEPTKRTGPTKSVQITSAQVDEDYIADRDLFDGVFLVALGAPLTAFLTYLAVVKPEVPLVLMLMVIPGPVVLTYVGCCILIEKMKRRPDKRQRRREKAI